MDRRELEDRTTRFAQRVTKFVAAMPRTTITEVIGQQLLKAGTSVGANYREVNRAESTQDFIHKLSIVEKEASETGYWLTLCEGSSIGDPKDRQWLINESKELLAIFSAANRTAKQRYARKR